MRLEHEAGVIFEVAHEGGAEAGLLDRHAPGGDEAVAAFERVERGAQVELRGAGQAPKLDRRLVGIARNREESFEHGALLRFDRLPRAQRGLLEKPVGDLARAAPADRVDARDRQEILDQRLRAGVVGAFQRRQHPWLGERALARAIENGLKAAPARDAPAQTPAPRLGNLERTEHALEQARVAESRGERRRLPQPSPPPRRARRSPRRPLRRPCGRSSRVRSASALRLGLLARGKPGPNRNIPRSRRPCRKRDRRGRRESYIRASGKAPRPRRRRSGTGGGEPPRPTCRERSPRDGESAARFARSRPQGNDRARVRPRFAAL